LPHPPRSPAPATRSTKCARCARASSSTASCFLCSLLRRAGPHKGSRCPLRHAGCMDRRGLCAPRCVHPGRQLVRPPP
jgi:hypothetical protein